MTGVLIRGRDQDTDTQRDNHVRTQGGVGVCAPRNRWEEAALGHLGLRLWPPELGEINVFGPLVWRLS